MRKYHKIQTVYFRDPENKHKTLLEGQFAKPEFEYLQNCQWIGTEKIHGTNTRVIVNPETGELSFRGKKDTSELPKPFVEFMDDNFDAGTMAEIFPNTQATLYGEGYGGNIQKPAKRYIPNGFGFILFDILITNEAFPNGIWLSQTDVEVTASMLGIKHAPIVFHGTLLEAVEFVRQPQKSEVAHDETLNMEGLVLKPAFSLYTRIGDRIITKLKLSDFGGHQ